MTYTLSLTQSQTLAALRSVLLTALPSGVEVIQSEDSRVPEPVVQDFIVMTPILRARIETNVASSSDVAFTGSIEGFALTVSSIALGAVNVAAQPTLFGSGVTAGTQITAQTSGPAGGAGAYTVSKSQSLSSRPLAAGIVGMMQPTQLTIQLDIHGPASADNAQIASTLLRSAYGVDLFAATGYDVTPLYAGDPRQMAFINSEQQYERRWTLDAVLQVNSIVYVPQQYFSAVSVTVEPPVDMH